MSSYVRDYKEEPDWSWWGSLSGAEEIPLESRVHSFNPIYRLSSRALAYVHDKLSQGWSGHHEVLLPTLLRYGGMGDFYMMRLPIPIFHCRPVKGNRA